VALDNSTLGKVFWQETEANAPKKQAGQYEIIRDKFPLEANLKFAIDSNMVQIGYPSRLPDALLQSYIGGKRKLVLLSRDKNVYPATLSSFTETDLVIEMKYHHAERLSRRRYQPILVVFSGEDDRKYVLQAGILQAYTFGVQLTYRDPRYDSRFLVKLAQPGVIHALSSTKRLELVAETLEPVREITWLTPSKGGKQITRIEDTLGTPESDSLYHPQDYVDVDSAQQAVVQDLSLGGVQLILDQPLGDPADKQLLQISLELPPSETYGRGTTLNILSVLTASRRVGSKVHVHCRFIWRLPDDLMDLFVQGDQIGDVATFVTL
jgi:hypothetical protein